MRVAYVTKELPFGATEAFILPEVEAHNASGWDVHFVPLSKAKMIHGEHLASRTVYAGLFSTSVLLTAVIEFAKQPHRVLRLLQVMLSARSRALRLRNVVVFPKALWLARRLRKGSFDHVHIHWIAAPATMGVVAAKLAGLPYSITAHRYDIGQNNLIAWKTAGARFVRAIDGPGAAEIASLLPEGQPGPVVLHMGVSVPLVSVSLRKGSLPTMRIAVAARLVPKKGHVYLLEAIRMAADQGVGIRLDIFGDGPLREELIQKAVDLGVDSAITWRGTASHDDLLRVMRAGEFDVCVLPSVTAEDGDREGIPVFLIEAMGIGLPVVTTANGGILELAGEGRSLIVPEKDAEALAEALMRLAHEPELRVRLGNLGRAHVQRFFDIEICMAELRSLMLGVDAEEQSSRSEKLAIRP